MQWHSIRTKALAGITMALLLCCALVSFAAVLFTFLGAYVFGGLHSYG
jgi:hypothetical protein